MSRPTVLICEDEGLTALRLRTSLARLGYDVAGVAVNGEEAVAAAARLRPDVILMDVEMPRLDGLAALRRIMQSRPTVILMLSAYNERETIDAAHEGGASGYLVKPVADDQLGPALAEAVERFTRRAGGGNGPA